MSLVLTSGLVIDAGTQQPQVEPFGELKRCVARTFQGENQPGILELSGAGINKAIDWVNLHHRFRFGRKQAADVALVAGTQSVRSEEHTSELQSLRRISYAVFCLKKKKKG